MAADTCFAPVGTLHDKTAVGRDLHAPPDSDRSGGFDRYRPAESAGEAVGDDILVDSADIEGRGEAVLVSGSQRAGDIDVTRGIEVLEVSPVPVQHAKHGVRDARDLADAGFRHLRTGGEGRETDDVQVGHLAPVALRRQQPGEVQPEAADILFRYSTVSTHSLYSHTSDTATVSSASYFSPFV